MARYSEVATSDEAVLVETDDFAIVFNKSSQKFYIKWWNAAASTWETRAQIDAADALQEVLPALTDDLELFFGADKDYAIVFDATDDVLKIKDKVSATTYRFARNQNRDFGVFSKHRRDVKNDVANGPSGSPATICSISVTNSDFQTLLPLNFSATPAGLATGESVVYKIMATLDDGGSVELYSSGAVTSTTIGNIADCDFSDITDGRRIVKLELTAESSSTSPTSTSSGVIEALEYD